MSKNYEILSVYKLFEHLFVCTVKLPEYGLIISGVYLEGPLDSCNIQLPNRGSQKTGDITRLVCFERAEQYLELRDLCVAKAKEIYGA